MPIFKSPAKINLFLRVLRKRSDGYHDIFSAIQPVSLYDEIFIEAANGSGITLSCSRSDVASGNANLAFRAAELFLKKTGLQSRLDIRLIKNTPVGAGLGGGSSNAATVLMALNGLLGAGVSENELMCMAAELGSDVPFFILKGPAEARGRGEVLKRLNIPPYNYVLVNPGFGVSTAWAYGNLDLTKSGEDNILSYSDEVYGNIDSLKDLIVNDLETVTLRQHPELSGIKTALIDTGAVAALMSGSGPTVFGLFKDRPSAISASASLERRFKGKGYSIYAVTGL